MIRIQNASPPSLIAKAAVLFCLGTCLFAQRGNSDWSTNGNDAQRSSWVRTDPKISPASLAGTGFQLVWKVKLGKGPLSAPIFLDRYIGYRGFRTYVFTAEKNNSFALDSDLGKIEWQKYASSTSVLSPCSGALTMLTRAVGSSVPANLSRSGGRGGRGGPAKSGVGEPLEGAVTLAQVTAFKPPTPPAIPPAASQPNRPPSDLGPRPTLLYGLTTDGTFHTMYVSNGEEPEPAAEFLPPNINVSDLSVVDGVAYAVTDNCRGSSEGLWALDLATKAVSKWQGSVSGGEGAFGPSAIYLTSQNKLLTLDPKTLAVSASYEAEHPFSTAPLVFEYKNKVMIGAASKDGVVHLVDAASPAIEIAKSPTGDEAPYALASWQTIAENRWIIATGAKSINAWKLTDQNGSAALQLAWTVHDVESPAAPFIVNGVLFALQRGDRSNHAVLLAFDAVTGKQIWTSGNTISSWVSPSGGAAAGGSSIFIGTSDGTLWDFSFPIEH